jgi:serine/threonine-protein kinase
MTLDRTVTPAHATVESVEFDLTGADLGSWRLERLLGEGAMGRVYIAKHHRIGRLAAVKVLKAEHARNPDLVQRFIAEATAVNAIKNEHIVEVFDFGEERHSDGSLLAYCVMELLDGRPLSDVMHEHFTISRTTKLAWQLSKALHAAHHIGVVHRDVKPENMFLHRRGDDDEFLKVLDFGIAKLLKPIGDIPQSGTAAGVVIGTPEYMSPEQALGAPTDRRADIYAVGLVLYELLAGVQPFRAETFGRLVVEITSKPPPPLPDRTALNEVIHPTLKAIVSRCLEKEPDRRFGNAEDLADALEPFFRGGPIRPLAATPVPLGTSLPPSPPTVPAVRPAAIVDRNGADSGHLALGSKRSRAPLFLVAGLGVGVLMLVGVLAWPSANAHSEERAQSPAQTAVGSLAEARVTTLPTRTVRLEMRTAPAGATVARADTQEILGVTPFIVDVVPSKSVPLLVRLDGYEAVERSVELLANASLSLDLVASMKQDAPSAPSKRTKSSGQKPVSRDGVVDPFRE